MDYLIVTDVLNRPLGEQRPGVAWGAELIKRGYKVGITAPCATRDVSTRLQALGFNLLAPPCRHATRVPLQGFLTALRAHPPQAKEMGKILNFSNQMAFPSHVYYFQGFLTDLARAMFSTGARGVGIGLPLFKILDLKWIAAMRRSRRIVANSPEAARQLMSHGLMPATIIPPPIPMNEWEAYREARPGKWGSSYVLIMLGKETNYKYLAPILQRLMRRKPILFAGAKMLIRPPPWLRGQHVGFVEEEEMPQLYAGAALTIFVYSHEPFGYVPIESAAAGSPALVIGAPHGPACYASIIKGIHYASPEAAPGMAETLLQGEEEVDRETALRVLNPETSLKEFLSIIG